MKQNLLILLSLGLLIACSSGSHKSDNSDSPAAESNSEWDTPPAAAPEPAKNKKETAKSDSSNEVKPSQPTPNADAQALVDAVKAGNDEAISKAASNILGKNPNDLRALNALGLYHYRKGHYPAALLMFNKAMKVNPNISEVHNNMGLTFLAQKENRDAMKEFRKAVELSPNDPIPAGNIGSIYIENKDYTKAQTALEIAYRKNSRDPKVLNNYGIALTANGKYNEAKDIYKQALSLSQTDRNIMLNYAILLIDHLKQNQEGLDLINKLRFLGPSTEARNRINVLENTAKAGLK